MKKWIYSIMLLLIILCEIIQAQQYATAAKKITAFKANEKITVDGVLSENIWKRAGFSEFFQEEPNQGAEATQKTEIWVAYDDNAIYYAAKYYDPHPDSILARLVRRDFVWGDPSDGTVLYLDSYGDRRSGYLFYVNAAGSLADGILENDNKQTDLTWDAVWEGVPKIVSDGWTVEIKIPFSQLRFKESNVQTWGIDVERLISRKAETDMIAFTPRNESGYASRFPQLVGIEGITPPARLELLPYGTGKAEYVGGDPGNPFNPGNKYTPGFGLDLRAGLGSSLTLNGTINPDFGQVEVDPAVVNLTDVETAYQEKRPFFTEGINIYRFGNGGTRITSNFQWSTPYIFYSRRIGRAPQGSLPNYDYADAPTGTHILGAAKVSGRIFNDWQIGSINAVTRREFADIDLEGNHSNIQIEPATYYGVLRLRKDFNQGKQGFGILSTFTNRFFNDSNLENLINKNALVVGTDGWTFLDNDRTYVLTGWAAVSRVTGNNNRMISLQRNSAHYFQRPDADYLKIDSSATYLTGYAGRLMLNKNRGEFSVNAAVGWISPTFEVNDLGFSSYSDVLNSHLNLGYRAGKPSSWYQNLNVNVASFVNFDFGGYKTANGYYFSNYIDFSNLSGFSSSFLYTPETFNGRRTRGGPYTLNPVSRVINTNLFTDNREWWVLNASCYYKLGDDAETLSYSTNFEFKISPTLTFQIGPALTRELIQAQWVTAYNDAYAKDTYNKRYMFAHLDQTTFSADIRADWIISPTLSFQIYMQPLIASGTYSQFKSLSKAKSFDFLEYGQNGSTVSKTVTPSGDILYTLDPDGSGPASGRTIGNPDFNIVSLRGSAVLRWEYLPGSSIYFVWTQNREDMQSNGEFMFDKSMNHLFDVRPDNIFMLKISYWVGM